MAFMSDPETAVSDKFAKTLRVAGLGHQLDAGSPTRLLTRGGVDLALDHTPVRNAPIVKPDGGEKRTYRAESSRRTRALILQQASRAQTGCDPMMIAPDTRSRTAGGVITHQTWPQRRKQKPDHARLPRDVIIQPSAHEGRHRRGEGGD